MNIISPLGDDVSSVELIDMLGSDLSVVNAARVSYAKRSEIMAVKDDKLINYLMKHKHGTPFEHVVFQFRVRAPLFVVHQWERHRMASYNEESGRYIELRPDFYTPTAEAHNDVPKGAELRMRDHWGDCFELYQELLEDGMSKEHARLVLPVSLYKEFWFTVNARSLMNFLELRNDDHAQWEIRQYAQALEEIFKKQTPAIAAAFTANGRIAP